MMILVDTTVWIDFFAGRDRPHALKMESLIEGGEDLCTCGVIMTEVLQGIRDDRACREVLALLSGLLYLPMDRAIFIQASKIYRDLRKKGITVRKAIDCMIASVCVNHNVHLLHNDRDFMFIADSFPLRIADPTP